jgi:choice-of-anchor B domain-containing protein
MKKYLRLVIIGALAVPSVLVSAQTPCENGMADIYPCSGVDLMSHMTLAEIGGGDNANDIWGWTDPESGHEYALVGRSHGVSFIDVTDPVNPVFVARLGSHISGGTLWRDIKVYQNHAFIVSEQGGHGLQVFDLQQLDEVAVDDMPFSFNETAYYDGFGNAHNVAINEETGFAYGIGTNTFGGGLHVVDISDPLNPVLAGGHESSGYTHDCQAVVYTGPDADYNNREIVFACNGNKLAIINAEVKSDIQELSTLTYPNLGYVHQGWLTEDQKYFLMNDEGDESQFSQTTHTHIVDVQDLDNPVYIGYHDDGIMSIDHNLYIVGNNAFMSNYTAGLRILDVTNVATNQMTEVGFFDIYPAGNSITFSGTWSNYPWFESGNIVVSTFTDFFVVHPDPEILIGVEEEAQIEIGLSPNPVASELKITLPLSFGRQSLSIRDTAGRLIKGNIPFLGGSTQLTVSVADLPSGVYLISLDGVANSAQRFVKL